MMPELSEVHERVLRIARGVARELGRDDDLDLDSPLFTDLNWRSIDMIVLAHAIQEDFARVFPFVELLQQFAPESRGDLTIRALADFVWRNTREGGVVAPSE